MSDSELFYDLPPVILRIANRIADGQTVRLDQWTRDAMIIAFENSVLSGEFRQRFVEEVSLGLDCLEEDRNSNLVCLDSGRIPEVGVLIVRGFRALSDDQLSCVAIKPMMLDAVVDELMSKHYRPGPWLQNAQKRAH